MITLVCGLPGTGKSTYTRRHLGHGVAYDLDALAGAFRLRGAHEEYHDAARHMANDLFPGFTQVARRYSQTIFVIRTAPDMDELQRISPDRVVMCMKQHERRPYGTTAPQKLMDIAEWCKNSGTPIIYLTGGEET